MAGLTPNQCVKTLGFEGRRVNVFIPKGRSSYYAFFRLRVPGTTTFRERSISCRTTNKAEAHIVAARIFVDELAGNPHTGVGFGPQAGFRSQLELSVQPWFGGDQTLPATPKPNQDPTIDETLDLYDAWIASATPGERRPQPSTVATNKTRLRHLARLLKVNTVSEMRASMNGLTHQKLNITPGNFVPLLRCAAGPFWAKVMNFYASRGIVFDTPFPTLPKVLKRPRFAAPTIEQVRMLAAKAQDELSQLDPHSYLLFLLCLGVGLRQQEATHVRWEDVQSNGIMVRNDWVHKTKSDKDRFIPVGPSLLVALEPYRRTADEWVVAECFHHTSKPSHMPKKRAMVTARRLATWIRDTAGVDGLKNPIHWLRKVFGSVVARDHGLFTASKYLGHSSITVTEAVYVGLLGHGPTANVI